MTHDPLDRVTEVLRSAVSETGDLETLPAGRNAAIAKLEAALKSRAVARRRRRTFGVFAAAAAAVAVVSSGAYTFRRGAHEGGSELGRVSGAASALTALRDGHVEPLGSGARVADGTELRTPSGGQAQLEFDTGTHVTIGSAARVRLVEQTRVKRFSVEEGAFHAKVAKLAADERFIVTTVDAEIEVRGTSFRVAVVSPDPSCGDGTPTRLDVEEGTVVVRTNGGAVNVHAGERWPACAAAQAPPGEPPAPAEAPPPAPARSTRATQAVQDAPAAQPGRATPVLTSSPSPVASPPPPVASPALGRSTSVAPLRPGGSVDLAASRLSEQNDLFDAAMRDKRAGRTSSALANLDRLLKSYPEGPLAENASVERMRVLRASDALDRARAVSAAREYLRLWPHGFARSEAEAVAAGGP